MSNAYRTAVATNIPTPGIIPHIIPTELPAIADKKSSYISV